MKEFKYIIALALLLIMGCAQDAQIASHNLSRAGDMFELNRRVIFYNGITGEYMLSIEGRLALQKDGMDNQLEVTCMTGPGEYKKHFLGLSDNVTYFCEQLEAAEASAYHYKVHFKPASIIPDIDLLTE